MLSPKTLERVSVAYRRGYIKPFADFDYDEGFKAGSNDRKWADYYSQQH